VSQEDLVYGVRKPKVPNLYVKMSGFVSWSVVGASDMSQPTFIQNGLVKVRSMNSGVVRRKEATYSSIIILDLGQEVLVKQSCCQDPSRKEGRIESQIQETIRSAGEIERLRTQQILKRLGQKMRESQGDKVYQYDGQSKSSWKCGITL